jgi:3-oxoacyl-[acyl-carrier-protein] synthase-1
MEMQLAITGRALVTAVGWNADTSCAAIRAGLTHLNAVPYFTVDNPDSIFAAGLMAANLEGLTDGYWISGTWKRLYQLVLDGLLDALASQSPSAELKPDNTALILLLPDTRDAGRFGPDDEQGPTTEAILDSMRRACGSMLPLALDPQHIEVVCHGQAGIGAALNRAHQWLQQPAIEYVMVAGLDSLVDPASLEWLAGADRLKTAANPVGVTPGEAGTLILLETVTHAMRRQAGVLGTITRVIQATEKKHRYQDEASTGKGLAEALKKGVAGMGASFTGQLIVDHNGEEWRAFELGCALSECSALMDPKAEILYPVQSTGEIGAAFGPLAICQALHAWQRGYHRSGPSLILASSDWGERAAILLQGVAHSQR